ncbi:hypothetical protein ABPG74_010898 [Tetrahymena malaccensis]
MTELFNNFLSIYEQSLKDDKEISKLILNIDIMQLYSKRNNCSKLKSIIQQITVSDFYNLVSLQNQLLNQIKTQEIVQKRNSNIFNELNAQIKQLESNALVLNNTNKLSENQISQLQNQCSQLNTQIKNLSENNKKLNEQLESCRDQHLIEIKEFQNKVKSLQQQYDQILNSKDQLSQNSIASINTLKDQLSKSKQQNEELQVNLQEYKVYKQIQDKQNTYIEQKKISQYNYDMVILMKSVFDLGKQDDDAVNQLQNSINNSGVNQAEQDFDEKNPGRLKIIKPNPEFNTLIEKATVVGMQGLRNRGKTYLLNCLIHENFPSGHHESTPGICLKYHSFNNSNVVYMDSEGLNCPVSLNYKKNKNYTEYLKKKSNKQELEADELKKKLSEDICRAYQDLKVTEQIQQDFIVENSDVLIVVVSQLTLDDQKLIHQLSDKFIDKYTQIPKKIIVVHNLIHFSNPKYIQNYMNEIMQNFHCYKKNLNNYKAENQSENRTILVDELKTHVNHVFMGRSESEAEEVFNRFALYFIRNEIESCQRTSHFDVIERFTKYLNQHLNDHIVFENNNNTLETTKDSSNYVSYDSETQSITLSDNLKIRKVKDLQMNVFGSIQKDCFYSIVDSQDGDFRYIIVELPGSIDLLQEYDQKNGKFHLVVKYEKEEDDLPALVYRTTRKKEEKSFYITICDEDQMYKFNIDDTEDLENGLYKFCFSKVKQTSLQSVKIKKHSKK